MVEVDPREYVNRATILVHPSKESADCILVQFSKADGTVMVEAVFDTIYQAVPAMIDWCEMKPGYELRLSGFLFALALANPHA